MNASNEAVIYQRWAFIGQGDSGAAQREMLTRAAASHGLEVIAEYVDAGCPGTSLQTCPQLRKLLEDAKAGRFQHVLVCDFSRLSRGQELATIVSELRRCRVALHCCGEGVLA